MSTYSDERWLRLLLITLITIFIYIVYIALEKFSSFKSKSKFKLGFGFKSLSQLMVAANEEIIKFYTPTEFALELKDRVALKQTHQEIGRWAYDVFIDYLDNQKDNDFLPTLLNINNMELGPQYIISYERLNEIANEIISEEGYIDGGNIE